MNTTSQANSNDMVSDEKKLELANTFLTSLRARNWELMATIFTDDCTWSLPGTSYISGDAIGAAAVIDKAQRIVSFNLNFQLNHVLYGSVGVALSLHNQASRGDLILDEYLATVCFIREGKIAAINTFLSDVDMLNNFFVHNKP